MRTIKHEQELASSKIATMLSQIQPHFLYNTLATIRALCRRDPKKAEIAAMELSDFLRGNMDLLTDDKPIPFEQELSHTNNYLALEQLRFPQMLKVKYDIGPKMFACQHLRFSRLWKMLCGTV